MNLGAKPSELVSEFETRKYDQEHLKLQHKPFVLDPHEPENSKRKNEVQKLEPSVGRRHFILRDTGLEDAVRPLLTYLMPLISCYFESVSTGCLEKFRFDEARNGLLPRFHPRDEREIIDEKPHPAPFISEIQLVAVDALAGNQYWHKDHTEPGLTIIIPLTLIPERMGATVFLPYTHRWKGFMKSMRGQCSGGFGERRKRIMEREGAGLVSGRTTAGNSNSGVPSTDISKDSKSLTPTTRYTPAGELRFFLKPTDVLIHDSRILKNADPNPMYSRATVALWIRVDCEIPPGQGIAMSQMYNLLGKVVGGIDRVQRWL